jgi:hypothetical protein
VTKKLFGTLSFLALLSAVMVRVFLELAFGGEHSAERIGFQAQHDEVPAAHSTRSPKSVGSPAAALD